MGPIVGLAATLAALLFAAWPLIRHQSPRAATAMVEDELHLQRDQALVDIRDVDFDRDLGNISAEDHLQLRDRYKRHAVAILKELNAHEGELDDEIERAVAALRHTPLSKP